MKNGSGQIKNLLLKSGIPLEVSVSKRLLELGYEMYGPVVYERDGRTFSTDLRAHKEMSAHGGANISLTLILECKHHASSMGLFFASFPGNMIMAQLLARDITLLETVDAALHHFNYEESQDTTRTMPLQGANLFGVQTVDRGVAIRNKRCDDQDIIKPQYQVLCGSVAVLPRLFGFVNDMVVDAEEDWQCQVMEDSTDPMTTGGSYPIGFIILPIVVTTSRLYVVKPEIGLEDIKEAKQADEFTEEVPGVALAIDPPFEIIRFAKEKITEEVLAPLWNEPFALDNELRGHSWREPVPRLVYFVNYQHLEQSLLSAESIIEKRLQDKYSGFHYNPKRQLKTDIESIREVLPNE